MGKTDSKHGKKGKWCLSIIMKVVLAMHTSERVSDTRKGPYLYSQKTATRIVSLVGCKLNFCGSRPAFLKNEREYHRK